MGRFVFGTLAMGTFLTAAWFRLGEDLSASTYLSLALLSAAMLGAALVPLRGSHRPRASARRARVEVADPELRWGPVEGRLQ